MGLLINGEWKDQWYDTKSTGGRFQRSESQFRNWITGDASSEFSAEPDRYHLYIAYACPWAHRALIFRRLKSLESIISLSVVHPLMKENGWTFHTDFPGATGDTIFQKSYLYEIYLEADTNYTGRVTVPCLWDRNKNTIVSNESADLIRMFNTAFNGLTGNMLDFYPESLQSQIDAVNEKVYHAINNGVYRAGFATTQQAYEEAYDQVFEGLDWIEERLRSSNFLCGETVTEADWRLYTTLIRFDSVYYNHFKCNRNRICDYRQLSDYLRCLHQMAGISELFNLSHTKWHYFGSHEMVNPTGVVPRGPDENWEQESSRRTPKIFDKTINV